MGVRAVATLTDKVQNALDEARMLVLGAQVLIGFQFKSAMEKGFEHLPPLSQDLKLLGLVLLAATLALLMAPAAFHQIVERGRDTERLHDYGSKIMCYALLPFGVGLGLDGYVAATKIAGSAAGIALGVGLGGAAMFFWYGLEAARSRTHEPHKGEEEMEGEQTQATKLKDRVKQVLTEARVVLPGAQALLGFQFIAILMESFDALPKSLQYVHLGSLALVALTTVLLMTPASYHRIVERGEDSEHFHRFASHVLLTAMLILPLGICGDVFVILEKTLRNVPLSAGVAAALLALFYALWFAFPLSQRRPRADSRSREEATA